MSRIRLNPRLAKVNRTYTVEEVARLYGLHRVTVRRWLKTRELRAIDNRRPVLIHGTALRTFLSRRRGAGRRPTPPGHIYCFSCRQHRRPALGMADFHPPVGRGAGNLRALCEACETVMNRRARWDAIPEIMPGVEVRVVERAERIAERSTAPLNVTSKKDHRG